MKLKLPHINTKRWQYFMSGNVTTVDSLRKIYPLAILIVVMLCIYIYLGFVQQTQEKEIKQLKKEIKESRYEMLDVSAEYTQRTLPSNISKELKERNSRVKETTKSPTIVE